MTREGLSRTLILSAILSLILIASTLPVCNRAYAFGEVEANISFDDGTDINQGAVSTATITIRNPSSSIVKLDFTGVRFDWLPDDTYLYGGGSEVARFLVPGEQAEYRIAFNVPPETTPGVHKAFIAVAYAVEEEGVWIGHHLIVEVHPGVNVVQVVTLTQTEVVTVTVAVSARQPSSIQTTLAPAAALALLAAIVASGYFLRRREKRRVKSGPVGGP